MVVCSGGTRDCVHGCVHHGDDDEDLGPGVRATQGELHEEPLELHGLLRSHFRVSIYLSILLSLSLSISLGLCLSVSLSICFSHYTK